MSQRCVEILGVMSNNLFWVCILGRSDLGGRIVWCDVGQSNVIARQSVIGSNGQWLCSNRSAELYIVGPSYCGLSATPNSPA